MESDEEYLCQTYSYIALRRAVGWIGILLPYVLMLGIFLFFKGEPVLKTISLYYYSGMRDVFVGSVCAIALFLIFYKGYTKWDNWTGNLAGFFAIGIALFPTSRQVPYDWAGVVHFARFVAYQRRYLVSGQKLNL